VNPGETSDPSSSVATPPRRTEALDRDSRDRRAARAGSSQSRTHDEELPMIAVENNVLPEVRLWRVAHAIHANISRTVVRQPTIIEHRLDEASQHPSRRERLDLALNILNLFVMPKRGALDEREPVKCFRGYCSAFAAQHHQQFMRDFIDELAGTGGSIPSERIHAWIEQRQASNAVLFAHATDPERMLESA
jgi:hypothetical protein